MLAEIAQGKSNSAIAESLVLTKRAVEKHINAIFMKLGLAQADDVSKRVKATLIFLVADRRPLARLWAPRGGHTPPASHRQAPLRWTSSDGRVSLEREGAESPMRGANAG